MIGKIGLRAPAFLHETHSNTATCQLPLAWQPETSSNGAVDGECKRACHCGCGSVLIIAAIFIDGRGFVSFRFLFLIHLLTKGSAFF